MTKFLNEDLFRHECAKDARRHWLLYQREYPQWMHCVYGYNLGFLPKEVAELVTRRAFDFDLAGVHIQPRVAIIFGTTEQARVIRTEVKYLCVELGLPVGHANIGGVQEDQVSDLPSLPPEN